MNTADLIEVPFRVWARGKPKNHALDGDPKCLEAFLTIRGTLGTCTRRRTRPVFAPAGATHRCKKRFLRFFYFGHVLRILLSKRFLFKKTLAKFRAASRLTRSTFKITAAK